MVTKRGQSMPVLQRPGRPLRLSSSDRHHSAAVTTTNTTSPLYLLRCEAQWRIVASYHRRIFRQEMSNPSPPLTLTPGVRLALLEHLWYDPKVKNFPGRAANWRARTLGILEESAAIVFAKLHGYRGESIMMRENEQSAAPPGIFATVGAGFDSTAKHLWLVLIPVLLDLYFWLGPRLSFAKLVEEMVSYWREQAAASGLNVEVLLEMAPRTNLFTSLSIPAIGVPAFVVGMMPEKTPLATSRVELENIWVWALLLITLSLAGLMLSTLYFGLIARAVREQGLEADEQIPTDLRQFALRVGWNWLQMLVVFMFLFAGMVIFFIPLMIISSLLSLVSGGLGMVVLFAGPMVGLWVLFYLSFVPHGLILNERSLMRAVVESFQLVRANLMPGLGLLLLVAGINRGMDWLLLLAEDGGWFTAVSIFGHGFVSTALVVATFIFYRDRYNLLFTPAGPAK